MDFVRFIRVLLRRKFVIITITLLAVVTAFFLTKSVPDIYKSEAQIATGITEKTQVSLESKDSEIKQFEIQNKFSNLIELIQSRKVLNLVSYRLLLNDLTIVPPFRTPNKSLQRLSQVDKDKAIKLLKLRHDSLQSLSNTIPFERELANIIVSMKYDPISLYKKLSVDRVEKSDFISVKYESENPDLSAFIVNTICEEVIRYYKIVTLQKSNDAIRLFSELAKQKKKELDEKVDELKTFKMQNGIINIYEQTKSLVDQVSSLELKREEWYKQIPSYKSAITLIDSKFTDKQKLYYESDSRPYNKRISLLKDNIKSLTDKLISTGFTDQKLKDSISVLRKDLEKQIIVSSDAFLLDPNAPKQELVNRRVAYEIDLEIAEYSVRSMDRELGRLHSIVSNYAPIEASISAYEREITVAADVYLLVLNKLNLARFENIGLGGDLKQTEYGEPARKPEPSKKMTLILLSGFLSFVLCVVVIFVLEYLDLTIKTPKQFEKLTGLKLLAYFNLLTSQKLDLKSLFSSQNEDFISDVYKELLRTFRYEVMRKMEDSQTLLFTSTGSREGKSLITSALAYSLSLTGVRVLILDTNFKNNSLTQNFITKQTLEKFFKDEITEEEAISNTTIENIDIIGCQGGLYSPSELITSERAKLKFNKLKQSYDYILMEGPSLNRYSDSKELASYTDKIIGVFSASAVLEEADRNSIRFLQQSGEKYIGSILNKVNIENLELVYGEIEKKRSVFRRILKKVARRNLSKSRDKEIKMN